MRLKAIIKKNGMASLANIAHFFPNPLSYPHIRYILPRSGSTQFRASRRLNNTSRPVACLYGRSCAVESPLYAVFEHPLRPYLSVPPQTGSRDQPEVGQLNLALAMACGYFSGAGRVRLSDDLLRFQSILAISSPDKRPGFDQRDCSSLGSAGQLEMRGLAGSSSGLRAGHWSVHTDRSRAHSAA